MLLLFPRCSWWSANEWILAPRIDVYGSASKGGKKILFSEKYLLRNSSLSLSLCIVICLIQILTRSKSIFLRGIFLTQFYTEYIPNLSRSSFHFRLISSINARVTRDNNNIQHVLRDANVTAPSLSLSPAWPSPECARYICPRWHFQSRRIPARGKHTGAECNRSLNFRDRWEVHASIGGFIRGRDPICQRSRSSEFSFLYRLTDRWDRKEDKEELWRNFNFRACWKFILNRVRLKCWISVSVIFRICFPFLFF